jgi:teichuronic acid biosynthesis glycosyltransferase TuaH
LADFSRSSITERQERTIRIAFLSHTALSSVFRVGSHHLARELAAMGHQVVHISNPASLASLVMRDAEFRRRARLAVPLRLHRYDGVLHAVPWSLFPLSHDPLGRPVTLGSSGLLKRRLAAAGLLPIDVALVDEPKLAYLLPLLAARSVIYRPTDVNVAPGTRTAEDCLLPGCRGVIATSQHVLDQLADRHRLTRTAVIANGVDFPRFSRAELTAEIGPGGSAAQGERRGAVYVGALDRRFDWTALTAAAAAHPAVKIDLFGPSGRRPVDVPANIQLRGPVPYAELPQVLVRYRVGLLPLSDEPTNAGRSPMKLYEYLAAGLSVWTRATPSLPSVLRDVHRYTGPSDAVATFGAALDDQLTGDGMQAARAMDWAARAVELVAAMTAMTRVDR